MNNYEFAILAEQETRRPRPWAGRSRPSPPNRFSRRSRRIRPLSSRQTRGAASARPPSPFWNRWRSSPSDSRRGLAERSSFMRRCMCPMTASTVAAIAASTARTKVTRTRLTIEQAIADADISPPRASATSCWSAAKTRNYVTVDYLSELAARLRQRLASITIEIHPLSPDEYADHRLRRHRRRGALSGNLRPRDVRPLSPGRPQDATTIIASMSPTASPRPACAVSAWAFCWA